MMLLASLVPLCSTADDDPAAADLKRVLFPRTASHFGAEPCSWAAAARAGPGNSPLMPPFPTTCAEDPLGCKQASVLHPRT
jgi:hypothetical protein